VLLRVTFSKVQDGSGVVELASACGLTILEGYGGYGVMDLKINYF
jgi:hypothetical protein